MDVIQLLYERLFAIRFLHLGYGTPASNSISGALNFAPDSRTKRLFRDYQMAYKVFDNVLVCFIRSRFLPPSDANSKAPYVPFLGEIQIRFLMQANQEFLSRTAIVAHNSSLVYHFSNRIDNRVGADLFASRIIETYSAGNDYASGTIVRQGAELFQTLRPISGSQDIPINDSNFWQEVLPVEPLVNNADIQDADFPKLESPCLGVIDIFSSGTSNTAYDLFESGPEGQLRSPIYHLRFKSRI